MEFGMNKKIFPSIIALSALFISGCAIFYSIYGLSKLFSGASKEVIIMASSLEIGKLIVASLLYRYWNTINKYLRIYLSIACVILMIITSGGIYGFLSGAYQDTNITSEINNKHVLVLQTKQNRFQEQLNTEKELVIYYTEALSNPTMIQYIDKETEQLVTTTSSRQRQLMTSQLNEAKNNTYILNDSISKYDLLILNKQLEDNTNRELGPLKYLAKSLNISIDTAVNIFLLLIIFVFDPLAISLVIAANFAFMQLTPKLIKEEPQYKTFSNWISSIKNLKYIIKK